MPDGLVRDKSRGSMMAGSRLRKGANAYSQIVLRNGSRRSIGRKSKTGDKSQRNMAYIMRKGLTKNTGSLQDIAE